MRNVAKIVALVIVVAIGASSLTVWPASSSVETLNHHGRCHEHGGKVPAPHPATYECCALGHDTALLQAGHSFEPLTVTTLVGLVDGPHANPLSAATVKFVSSSIRPPGVTPLRI